MHPVDGGGPRRDAYVHGCGPRPSSGSSRSPSTTMSRPKSRRGSGTTLAASHPSLTSPATPTRSASHSCCSPAESSHGAMSIDDEPEAKPRVKRSSARGARRWAEPRIDRGGTPGRSRRARFAVFRLACARPRTYSRGNTPDGHMGASDRFPNSKLAGGADLRPAPSHACAPRHGAAPCRRARPRAGPPPEGRGWSRSRSCRWRRTHRRDHQERPD